MSLLRYRPFPSRFFHFYFILFSPFLFKGRSRVLSCLVSSDPPGDLPVGSIGFTFTFFYPFDDLNPSSFPFAFFPSRGMSHVEPRDVGLEVCSNRLLHFIVEFQHIFLLFFHRVLLEMEGSKWKENRASGVMDRKNSSSRASVEESSVRNKWTIEVTTAINNCAR